jgi:hypothetical protein
MNDVHVYAMYVCMRVFLLLYDDSSLMFAEDVYDMPHAQAYAGASAQAEHKLSARMKCMLQLDVMQSMLSVC